MIRKINNAVPDLRTAGVRPWGALLAEGYESSNAPHTYAAWRVPLPKPSIMDSHLPPWVRVHSSL
jgi:hypothetical protein